MAVDIERALSYPTNSEDWVKIVLIGGLLALFSVLIVPLFLLYGYLVRVLRAGMAEAAEPPAFDDWGTLLVEGVVAFVILLVYQLIPLIVAAVTVGGSLVAIGTGSEAGAGVGILGLLAGFALSGLLALAFGYLTLIALANYAHVGGIGAAFDVDVLRSVALDEAYAIPWLYGIGVLIGATVVSGLLGIVPLLGAIAGVFVTFYGQVVAAWIWGKGFADATGVGGADEAGTDTATDLDPGAGDSAWD
jgi:hypothetical protein